MWQAAGRARFETPRTLCNTLCSCAAGDGALVARQQLFSVYVHVPPGAELEDDTSLFRPHVIADRVATSWGGFSLVQVRAARPPAGAAQRPAVAPLLVAVPVLHRAALATKVGARMCSARPLVDQQRRSPPPCCSRFAPPSVALGGGLARQHHGAGAPERSTHRPWRHRLWSHEPRSHNPTPSRLVTQCKRRAARR